MAPNLGGWIHSFTVTDTQIHTGGYTIYKITSIVFPRSLPQALTCLTIWKRFHDIKRLHRELSRRHRGLKLPGQLPEPTDCSFFKRFDADVIRRRKEYILKLLYFAAQHSALYKCQAFTQFFSESQQTCIGSDLTSCGLNKLTVTSNLSSPLHRLHATSDLKGGAIEGICDKLDIQYNLHEVCENIDLLASKSDNENDKNHTHSSISENVHEADDAADGECDHQKPCKDYMRFLTPMASIENDECDYIYEAALEFSKAVQAEANVEYKEAHVRYKRGVELLLIGSKDDTSDERKLIAKAKISKYLARADDIFDKFLWDNTSEGACGARKNFQLSIDIADCGKDGKSSMYLERPWNHLAKYKVLRILGDSVMQVYCVTEPEPRKTYVMKGIEKPSSNMPTPTIFLPQQVPYMVALLAFFQSEHKVFLLLKYAEGGLLYDYIKSYKPAVVPRAQHNFLALFPEEINTPQLPEDIDSCKGGVEDRGFKENGKEEKQEKQDQKEERQELKSLGSVDFSELVRSSQQLLQSVSKTLQEVKQLEVTPETSACAGKVQPEVSNTLLESSSFRYSNLMTSTKLPEASLKQWARELAVAIHGLHVKGVILSDLHMENLLLGAKGQLMLTYFYQNEGVSNGDSYIHKAYSSTALNGHYVAPERPLTFKSDWWSYGVILYELLLGIVDDMVRNRRRI